MIAALLWTLLKAFVPSSMFNTLALGTSYTLAVKLVRAILSSCLQMLHARIALESDGPSNSRRLTDKPENGCSNEE
jgi:hypothetical protein